MIVAFGGGQLQGLQPHVASVGRRRLPRSVGVPEHRLTRFPRTLLEPRRLGDGAIEDHARIGFSGAHLLADPCSTCGENTLNNFLTVVPGGAFRWLAAHQLKIVLEAPSVKKLRLPGGVDRR